MDYRKAVLKSEIQRLENENNALRKELELLQKAADPAEGFISDVALMPQLDQEIRDKALKHREALRAAIKLMV